MYETLAKLPPSDLDKRRNGIFYTPPEATAILCNWGIRSSQDNILEPGFGGCGFLSASTTRLLNLNCFNPKDKLFGCDIDHKAFDHLARIVGISDITRRFIHNDFLKLKPNDFAVNVFDCVLGNPPYVSHQNMSDTQKATARESLETSNIKLSCKPSLWAYFLIHSLQFLRTGGRVAWVLPSSFLHADYAKEVRDILQQHFTRSLVIVLGERIFITEGTEERTVVLLCEGWSADVVNGSMEVGFASDLTTMASIISLWDEGSWHGTNYDIRPNLALMSDELMATYNEVATCPEAKSFGDLCKIRIGIVTGANKFFVINNADASIANLPEGSLSYILAKFGDIAAMNLLKKDLQSLKRDNKRCLLIDTSLMDEIKGTLKEYLDSFPEDKRKTNKTFYKRNLWHQPNDGQIPDAFFPYMQNHGPSLLLNSAKITSTNTIHRIFFNDSVTPVLKKTIAISILSTFSQLSAEIQGRSYGSGVLKHEPSEAARITLLLPSKMKDETIRETFNKVDKLLRRGSNAKARALADQFVFANYSKRASELYLNHLEQALVSTRARRIRPSETSQTHDE
ncbi:MAG TPA: N-6 DNA methylase [Pyrinomonadaceae bacterium]|jgi:adenine-specific DNA methylase|nr:N-6 DNA methylase [Pyrinomonadaceae bacterium]